MERRVAVVLRRCTGGVYWSREQTLRQVRVLKTTMTMTTTTTTPPQARGMFFGGATMVEECVPRTWGKLLEVVMLMVMVTVMMVVGGGGGGGTSTSRRFCGILRERERRWRPQSPLRHSSGHPSPPPGVYKKYKKRKRRRILLVKYVCTPCSELATFEGIFCISHIGSSMRQTSDCRWHLSDSYN